MRKYPTNKIFDNYTDEKWSIDSADFSDYKVSNNKKIQIYLCYNP